MANLKLITAAVFSVVITAEGAIMDTVDSPTPASARHQYFESWVSYSIPVRPSRPISYADTENLASFYLATIDRRGQLLKFVKYWKKIEKIRKEELEGASAASGYLYFTEAESNSGKVSRGLPIPYAQTEQRTRYIRGTLHQGSALLELELVQIKYLSVDEYEYWPNGSLRMRRLTKENGTVSQFRFDDAGNQLR